MFGGHSASLATNLDLCAIVPRGSLSQLLSCPAPTHPTVVMSLHSPYTIAPCSVVSLLNAGNIALLSVLTGLIRWLENMCLSALRVQVPFLGMEIPCSAAG